jgi:hypothetical protein
VESYASLRVHAQQPGTHCLHIADLKLLARMAGAPPGSPARHVASLTTRHALARAALAARFFGVQSRDRDRLRARA